MSRISTFGKSPSTSWPMREYYKQIAYAWCTHCHRLFIVQVIWIVYFVPRSLRFSFVFFPLCLPLFLFLFLFHSSYRALLFRSSPRISVPFLLWVVVNFYAFVLFCLYSCHGIVWKCIRCNSISILFYFGSSIPIQNVHMCFWRCYGSDLWSNRSLLKFSGNNRKQIGLVLKLLLLFLLFSSFFCILKSLWQFLYNVVIQKSLCLHYFTSWFSRCCWT